MLFHGDEVTVVAAAVYYGVGESLHLSCHRVSDLLELVEEYSFVFCGLRGRGRRGADDRPPEEGQPGVLVLRPNLLVGAVNFHLIDADDELDAGVEL